MNGIKDRIKRVISLEGGYVDHPLDKGGATKFGITRKTLSEYRGYKVSKNDVAIMTEVEAYDIYYSLYYQKPRINNLPSEIQGIMLDMCVNHGPRNSIKILQKVIIESGLAVIKVDGINGSRTIGAARRCTAVLGNYMINALVDARIIFYKKIVESFPDQQVFLKGWLNRAEKFRCSV